jgi:hypothetical protein
MSLTDADPKAALYTEAASGEIFDSAGIFFA